jgi:hypothetical protein
MPSKIRTSAMTCGYYRTSSPVTALPMIMRWISDVPSKIVKLVEARAVSAGRRPVQLPLVSTNSARLRGLSDASAAASYALASFSRRLATRSLISSRISRISSSVLPAGSSSSQSS